MKKDARCSQSPRLRSTRHGRVRALPDPLRPLRRNPASSIDTLSGRLGLDADALILYSTFSIGRGPSYPFIAP